MKNGSVKLEYLRPRAWQKIYKWHLGQVPDTDSSKKSAIFVVHGMGMQAWAETSAILRSGVENALDSKLIKRTSDEVLPAPFIQDGFWADYDDLTESFKDEVPRFQKTQLNFFKQLWKSRSISRSRTFAWFLWQLVRLVFDPRIVSKVFPLGWFIYIMLLFVVPPILLIIYLFVPSVMSNILNDVRLYCSPRGMIERAIVQRIDFRVGEALLRMMGLNWDFRKIKENNDADKNGKKYIIDGNPVEFDRVFWVSHSLGTVISYNVMSDLFNRANELAKSGDQEQKDGVNKFWASLQRFITMGSPLDKIAVLFGNKVLRRWPHSLFDKMEKEEILADGEKLKRRIWINYYHFLDPVSGALTTKFISGNNRKLDNYHLKRFFYIPGLAHTAYWKDKTILSYLLSRFYGKNHVVFIRENSWPATTLTLMAVLGYLIWLAIILLPIVILLLVLGVF